AAAAAMQISGYKTALWTMLSPVLPAAVKSGVCMAVSRRFLIPCGNAPSAGWRKIIIHRASPFIAAPLRPYSFAASSWPIGSSLGKVFFGRGSFLTGARFGAAAPGGGGAGALATGGGAGLAAAAGAAAGTAGFSAGAADDMAAGAAAPSPWPFLKRDRKFA